MAKENLTDSFLRSQRWAERMGGKPQIDVWDTGRHGLVMRVTEGVDDEGRPKFTFTWCVIYSFRGRKRRLALGRWSHMGHEAARRQADKMFGKIANDIDPVAEKRAQLERARERENVVTVQHAAVRYLNEYRTRRREKWRPLTEYTNRRMMESEVMPVLGSWPVVSVTSRQIESLLQAILKRETKGTRGNEIRANRVRVLISGLFKWAKRERLVAVNPVTDVEPLGAERARSRKLSHAEIKKLWQVLGDGDVADQYRFMLITGQRVGECAKLEWQEIDLDTEWWTIPSEKSKNHLEHRVPLGPLAMEILTRRRPQRSGFVFPHAAGSKSIPSWRQEKIVKACDFVKPWQPKDLRRTVASEISPEFGTSRVAQLLNHLDPTAPKVTGLHYDRGDQDPAKRKAMAWWNERLHSIVTSTAVPLRPASAA